MTEATAPHRPMPDAAPIGAEAVLAAAPATLYVFDLRGERNVWVNPEIGALLGHDEAAMSGGMLERLLHPDDAARCYPDRLEALQRLGPGETSRFVFRARHADGGWRHLESVERAFARGPDGAVTQVIGAAFDVTEREAREAELKLLNHELVHRLRNVFAVLGGLVRTAGRGSGPEAREVLRRLAGRVHGLALAHEVLREGAGMGSAGLRAVIDRTLDPYREGHQIVVRGDDPLMPGEAVLPLGLIAHELATNAVKHGALGEGGGSLDVVVADGADVVVTWHETGGGAPAHEREAARGRGGFGDALMRGAAQQLGGRIERRIEAGGATVELRFPRMAAA